MLDCDWSSDVCSSDLIGRADRIVFSSAGRSLFYFWTWRADRFFKAVE
jgi:signal peptidase I